MNAVKSAIAWLDQALSDARTADRIASAARAPMLTNDVPCHVALLCAQSFEKCIKGCQLLIGQTPKLSHDAEAKLDSILRIVETKPKKRPERALIELFREREVRSTVKTLLGWTPGNAAPGTINYEYPWNDGGDLVAPCNSDIFGDVEAHKTWVRIAKKLSEQAKKVAEALSRSVL